MLFAGGGSISVSGVRENVEMKYSFCCLLLLLLPGCPSSAQQNQAPSGQRAALPVPAGWSLYPKPASESPDMLCGNYSKRSWFVSLEGGQLKTESRSEDEYRKDALPFKISLKKNQGDGIGGRRFAYQLNDGWLVGFNRGEFGGSLWWFSPDGEQHRKLANENVQYFVKLSEDILVLTGLAHLGLAEGKVLRVSKSESGDYKAQVLVDLDGEPYAFIQESQYSLLIITTAGLRRVKASGSVERLAETDYGILYPTSMVLAENGVIYVGMRHYVTRLTPTQSGYQEEWLVPSDCTKFKIRDYECVCTSSRTN
jgi:hypothetical protein